MSGYITNYGESSVLWIGGFMTTLAWRLSATIAYKNNDVEEIMAQQQFGSDDIEYLGKITAFLDIGTHPTIRTLAGLLPVTNTNIRDISFNITYRVVGSEGYQEITDRNSVIANNQLIETSLFSINSFNRFIRNITDGCLDGNDIVFGDYGDTWAFKTTFTDGYPYCCCQYKNKNYFIGAYDQGNLYKSSDFGENWSKIGLFDATGIQGIYTDDNFILTITTNGNVFRSDDGINWNQISTGISAGMNLALINNQIWAGVNGAIKYTSDGGYIWSTITMTGKKVRWAYQLRSGVILIGGYYTADNSSFIGRSIDNGLTWRFTYTNAGAESAYPAIEDLYTGLVWSPLRYRNVTNAGKLLSSDDEGITWIEKNIPGHEEYLPETLNYDGLLFSNMHEMIQGVEIPGNTPGRLYRSYDHGTTWNQIFITNNATPLILPQKAGIVLAGYRVNPPGRSDIYRCGIKRFSEEYIRL